MVFEVLVRFLREDHARSTRPGPRAQKISEDPQRMTRLVSQSIWRPLWMIWEPEHIRAYSIVVIWCHFLVARFCWPELNQDIWAKVCERFGNYTLLSLCWDEEGALQLVTKDSTNRERFTTPSTFSSWPCDTLCLMYFHTKMSCLTVVCMYVCIYLYIYIYTFHCTVQHLYSSLKPVMSTSFASPCMPSFLGSMLHHDAPFWCLFSFLHIVTWELWLNTEPRWTKLRHQPPNGFPGPSAMDSCKTTYETDACDVTSIIIGIGLIAGRWNLRRSHCCVCFRFLTNKAFHS